MTMFGRLFTLGENHCIIDIKTQERMIYGMVEFPPSKDGGETGVKLKFTFDLSDDGIVRLAIRRREHRDDKEMKLVKSLSIDPEGNVLGYFEAQSLKDPKVVKK